jgi:hypothetical protein
MTNYTGFFVRDNLGQVPNQQGVCWSSSPDIIFNGTTAQQNPSLYTTAAGYATDYGATVYLQTPNYVYLRALNTNPTGPVAGRAWFYFVESDLALWPQNWRGFNGDCVSVAGNPVNYQKIMANTNGEVCIAGLPYIWTPPPLASGTHYCAVNWIDNSLNDPGVNPVSTFGNMGSFDALVAFVLAHPNMGWRNTSDVSGLGLTWSQTTNITGPATPGQFNVGVQCTNMPTDGLLGFDIPPPATGGSGVTFPLAPIPQPNYQGSVKITDWPANATTSITVNYKQGATPPPAGSNIVVTLTTPYSTLTRKTQRAVDRNASKFLLMQRNSELNSSGQPIIMITPTPVVLVGSQTYSF